MGEMAKKMKKAWLVAFALASVLACSVSAFWVHTVSGDSAALINYPDAGLNVYSPLSVTYSGSLVLNVTLGSAGNLGGLDPNISMNYTIDGTYTGAVQLRSNGEIHMTTIAVGTAALPALPEGAHSLTIHLYGLNQRAYEPKYLTFEYTIFFSTTGTSTSPDSTTAPNDTPSPTATPSPSTLPSPSQTPTPAATTTAPEFPSLAVPLALMTAVLLGAIVHLRKVHRSAS
jgi:hypothetical protein